MLIHYHHQILKGKLYLLSKSLHALGRKGINGLLMRMVRLSRCVGRKKTTDLDCFEYLQTNSKCFELLSCAYTVKPLISIYGGDFSLLIFEHAINLNSKIGICKLRWRFQMFRMRIRFSQGRYSFVWIDIAIDLSRQRSENLRNLTLRESTA